MLLFAYALPVSLSLGLTMCMVLLPRPPHGLPEAACVPSTNSVCLHLRIIDACREASLTASQSQLLSSLFPYPFLISLSWSICCLCCLSCLVGDNNNSSELRAGWEMPLICSSCQLSRSEMKWKSHALMADDEAGPPSHSTDPFPRPQPLMAAAFCCCVVQLSTMSNSICSTPTLS